jgi:hypothetical protein
VLVGPEGLVVVLGGLTVAVDIGGRVMWVRESEAIPLEADLYAVRQQVRSATLVGRRLLVAQPGVPSLECLDPGSGDLLWRRVLPDIEAIVGVEQNSVFVRLRHHVASFDIATGDLRWRRRLDDQLLAACLLGPDRLLASRAVKAHADRRELCPQLLVLDTDTGQILQQRTCDALVGQQPRLGPLLPVGDRLLTFWGDGQRTANREIILFSPP